MDMKKKLEVMQQIEEANKRHVEEWMETKPFYALFGSDPLYPFKSTDYVLIEAQDKDQAYRLFQVFHPNRPGSKLANCAAIYSAEQFAPIQDKYYKGLAPVEIISARVIRNKQG